MQGTLEPAGRVIEACPNLTGVTLTAGVKSIGEGISKTVIMW